MRKLLLLPVIAVALATAGPALADDVAVGITKAGFVPPAVSIQNGDRVVWTNNDATAHQIVADDGSFRSASIAPGGRYAHVFRAGGTFGYHDGTNTAEKGTVTVADARSVSIAAGARIVSFNGYVLLRGSVSSGKAGEQVVIRQKPQGSDVFLRAGTVATTANGLWQIRVQPRRNAVYDAVWKNIRSENQPVFVKPLLKLKQSGRNRFTLGIHAQTKLVFRTVLIQRWVAKTHRWVTVKTTRPTLFRAAARESVSTAVFRLKVRRGTIIRALLPRSQAGPAYYGPASSRSIRV
jgi:plastocyanin